MSGLSKAFCGPLEPSVAPVVSRATLRSRLTEAGEWPRPAGVQKADREAAA